MPTSRAKSTNKRPHMAVVKSAVEPPKSRSLALQQWLNRLEKEDLPVFAHTTRCMASLASEDEASARELANVILRDSPMTARVLRLANSVVYNPVGRPINTVSYAIVLLGFESIRNLALSISLIDTVLNGIGHNHAINELVRSFHAAVQARTIAERQGQEDSEEIFIGAVLNRLGPIVFWCFPYGKDEALLKAYANAKNPQQGERKTLGFTLQELTVALAEQWKLSTLLGDVLQGNSAQDQQGQWLQIGLDIADHVQDGWQSPAIGEDVAQMTERLAINADEAREFLYQNARLAVETLRDFGIDQCEQLLPPKVEASQIINDQQAAQQAALDLQMQIARELTTMLTEQVDLNTLLSTVLEGIYRALKMDRVLMALVDRKHNKLVAKYVLGQKRDWLLKRFQFAATPASINLFSHVLRNQQALWFQPQEREGRSQALRHLYNGELREVLGLQECFCLPIYIGDQSIGLIYADCHTSQRPLSEADYLSFRHFGEHASIAFSLMKRGR